MREASISGPPHNPGAGGWPTLRYFNKETGIDGKTYEQKTGMRVCDEMKELNYMYDFIEEQGNTFLCSAVDGKGCNPEEMAFIEMLKDDTLESYKEQLEELESDDGRTSYQEKKRKILKQFVANSEVHEEL